MDDTQDKLNRIETKIDRLDYRLDNVDVRLQKYNSELEFHIARTNQIEDDLMPIVNHVEQIRGAAKLIAFVSALIGFALMIAQFLQK